MFNKRVYLAKYFSIAPHAGKIPELDGFRAIAILLVLLRHAVRPIYDMHGTLYLIGSWELATPFLNGWMGVDLFFVLSGFLITHHLLRYWPDKITHSILFYYCKKRILRIFPAYYTCVFVVALGLLPFYQPHQLINVKHEIFKHLIFMQDYQASMLLSSFWSLGVEVKFYIICPLVLWWLKKYSRQKTIVILLLLAMAPMLMRLATLYTKQNYISTYPAFFWNVRAPAHLAFDGLWIGFLCALIFQWYSQKQFSRINHRLIKLLLTSGLTVFLFIYFSIAWFDHHHFLMSTMIITLAPVSFGAIILAVLMSNTFVNSALKNRHLRYIAVLSYSIYLTHLIFLPVALNITNLLFPAYIDYSPLLKFFLFAPLFFLISILSGLLLHLLVEKPFLLIRNN